MNYPYHVIETPMFPAKWKVEDRRWPGRNNSTSEYFRGIALAQKEADRRNMEFEASQRGPLSVSAVLTMAMNKEELT